MEFFSEVLVLNKISVHQRKKKKVIRIDIPESDRRLLDEKMKQKKTNSVA
jgi:hypothetical protein